MIYNITMPNRYRYAVELLRFQENDRVTKDCWSLLEIENLEWLKHFELSKNKIVSMVENNNVRTCGEEILKIKKMSRFPKFDDNICEISIED
jgi:hypothetical protein